MTGVVEVAPLRTVDVVKATGVPAVAARVARDLVEHGTSDLAPALYGWPAVVAVLA